MASSLRLVLAVTSALALAAMQTGGGCGFDDDEDKGVGEPCTRSVECRGELICTGGVCAAPPSDAGAETDAGLFDAGRDAGEVDSGPPEAGVPDGGPVDAGPVDAGPVDAGPVDAGPVDAGPADGGPVDAGPDGGPFDAGPDAG